MSTSQAWSWRHAILSSDLPSTTRFVLLVIGCHMNEKGQGCFPTIKDLMEESRLSNRTVCTHIDIAVKAGWLKKSKHGFRGQKWKTHEYEALWPDRNLDPISPPETEKKCLKGSERGSLRSDDISGQILSEGSEPNDIKVVKEVHQDNSISITSHISSLRSDINAREDEQTNLLGERSRTPAQKLAQIFEQEFNEFFWPAYPNKVGKKPCLGAFTKARKAGTSLTTIMDGLKNYVASKPSDRAWLNPQTFLNQERWSDEHAPLNSRNNGRQKSSLGIREGLDAALACFDGQDQQDAAQPTHTGPEIELEANSRRDDFSRVLGNGRGDRFDTR